MIRLMTREFVVQAPQEVAWQHLANVEQWTSWAEHITSVRLSTDQLQEHSAVDMRLKIGISAHYDMTEIEAPNYWVWGGKFLWLYMLYNHIFEPINEHETKLIWTIDASGFGVSWLGRVFTRIYEQNLNRAIPNLIQELESLDTPT